VPERRLLMALIIGAALYALTAVTAALWPIVVLYNAAVVGLALRDARRLPGPGGFRTQRLLARPLSLGARQEVIVQISAPAAAGMAARVGDHVPAELLPDARELLGRFDGSGRLELSYHVQPPHRGAFHFGRVDVRCSRPGGWWARQLGLPAAEEVAVYPDVLQVRTYQLSVRRGLRLAAGLRRDRPPGAATAFAALRDYLPGDDMRRVDWKATARRDRPITAEVEAERGQQLLIALDCGRLMTARAGRLTKLDNAVNAALLLAWVAQAHGDRVGLVAFADRILGFVPPQRGSAQVRRINQALYAVQARSAEPDFQGAAGFLARRVPRRSLVVLLTDVLDIEASADLVASALHLGRRHLVLVVAMADPAVLASLTQPVATALRAYEWAAAEELTRIRRTSFEVLQRGGVLGLDVTAGELSPRLVERYLELKERALI
jgi:uncharacterized protein (DUF58 family)